MMLMAPEPATIAIAACAGLTAVYFCLFVVSRLRDCWPTSSSGDETDGSRLDGGVYRDEDGEALHGDTPKHQVIWARVLALSLAGVVSLAAFTAGGLRRLDARSGMIYVGWILIDLMTLVFSFEQGRRRYATGRTVLLCSLALSLALLIDMFSAHPLDHGSWDGEFYETLCWVQLAAGIGLSWVTAWVPRRPAVYFKDKAVDAQYTCSTSERYGFSWVQPFLTRARKSERIEQSDLPILDLHSRTMVLKEEFPNARIPYGNSNRLWRAIVKAHWNYFVLGWCLCLSESMMMAVPSLCLYYILRILEAQTPNEDEESSRYAQLRLWIFCLAAAKFAHVFLDTQLVWHAFSNAVNVRSEISALIYAKALRMRIVAGSIRSGSKSAPVNVLSNEVPVLEEISPPAETDPLLPARESETARDKDKDDSKKAEDEDESGKIAREIVSLLGMDVTRIYIFTGWNVDLVRGIIKILVGLIFLAVLLGWWSTLAGMAIPALLHPLNQHIAERYKHSMLNVSNARDQNTHVITEALHGIRQIKLSATEPRWEAAILAGRRKVLNAQWERYLGDVYIFTTWASIPILMGAASLTVFALQSNQITASIAFTVLAVFTSLEYSIAELPMTITELIDALVSCKRVEEFFNSDEQQDLVTSGNQIRFTNATIAWPSNDEDNHFALSDLNLEFPPKELSVIYGKTGAGKSLLLAAMLGEAEVLAGTVQVPERPVLDARGIDHLTSEEWNIPTARAFVAQDPWIENASVKNSILYGLPYRRDRYDQVVKACALDIDIDSFPDGDDTEIGETGINLSGGQRWRLTLARALYSRAGILIMDDIFSAVDAHVGRHLLQHAVTGKLAAGRTRILVTHHLGLVAQSASYIVDLDKGTGMSPEETFENHPAPFQETRTSSQDDKPNPTTIEEELAPAGTVVEKPKPRKFVEDETRATGRVSGHIYSAYITASGGPLPYLIAILIFVASSTLTVYRSYWLVLWINSYSAPSAPSPGEPSITTTTTTTPTAQASLPLYLGLYISLALGSILLTALKTYIMCLAGLRATRRLFERVTARVLRARTRWLDTEPTGRILNRFVADFSTIDNGLGLNIIFTIDGSFHLLTIVVAALLVSAWMLVPIALLVVASALVVRMYLPGARDIKRLNAILMSPVLELVNSSLAGLATVRAFGRVDAYLGEMYERLDRFARATRYSLLASSWVRFRQGAVGVLLTLAVAVVVSVLHGRGGIDGAMAGFALSFALNFSTITDAALIRYTALELDMNCVERVVEYAGLDTEPAGGEEAPARWPPEGRVEVQELVVGYAADLPPVLKGVSFTVPPRSRVGIVGRTGSGKTSLALALFRLLEARSGRVLVDGVDTASLKLSELRRRLAIIPQEPALFSGTIRSNLDPDGAYGDEELLAALQRVRLIPSSLPLSPSPSQAEAQASSSASSLSSPTPTTYINLSSSVSRGGANLSQGQRQLLCLARAILTQPKVLVLDEATSAVDMATDAQIRRSLREDFPETTMLVVAHRLSTVVDMDWILVMKDGEAVEFDRPETLARQENGVFRGLLKESGEASLLEGLLEKSEREE